MASAPSRSSVMRRSNAFTLFELLVSIAVITIIIGVGFVSIGGQTEARKLDRGLETLHSMIRIARTHAITNGVPSRLIINLDESDPGNYLRRIGVMIQAEELGKWQAVERGALLPEGVYLVPQNGNVTFPSSWPANKRKSIYKTYNTAALGSSVFNYEYPLKDPVPEGNTAAPKWLAIQFSPNGRLGAALWGGGGLVPMNNQLVLALGSMEAGTASFRSPNEISAIVFKISGSTYKSVFTELDESGI